MYLSECAFYTDPLSLQAKIDNFTNNVDPYETARNEPFHLNLHYLPFYSRFMADIPIRNNGCAKIRRKSLVHKLRGKMVKFHRHMKACTRL